MHAVISHAWWAEAHPTEFSARSQLRRGTSPGLFARWEYASFGSFVDHANQHKTVGELARLLLVGVGLALFFDLGVLALIAAGDPDHAVPITIATAMVFNVLAGFAVYKVVRKRRFERERRRRAVGPSELDQDSSEA